MKPIVVFIIVAISSLPTMLIASYIKNPNRKALVKSTAGQQKFMFRFVIVFIFGLVFYGIYLWVAHNAWYASLFFFLLVALMFAVLSGRATTWNFKNHDNENIFYFDSMAKPGSVSYDDVTQIIIKNNVSILIYIGKKPIHVNHMSFNSTAAYQQFIDELKSRCLNAEISPRNVKDYFDGNIKAHKQLFITLCVFSVLMFLFALGFLLVALFDKNCEAGAKIILVVFSIILFPLSFGYTPLTIYFVKNRKKYPRIAALLVKKDQFVD